jgi:hypothetical protein
MTELFRFDPPADDPLGVLSGTATVMAGAAGASHVRIDADAVRRFADAWRGRHPTPAEDALHCTFLPPRRRLNVLLVLEALNFCFWDDPPRWRVSWEGRSHDGYWALAAALRRALVADALPLWDAHWLARLDAPAVARLLRGEGRPVPLLETRLAHLREAGAVLEARWGGQFARVVAAAQGDAPALVRLIATEFPSFRDEARWQGRPVPFLKRAQICVADLARQLAGHPLGALRRLERLTAFADYKVPQVLRKEGILAPSPALAARLDAQEPLPAGSPEEVELRAATVWAVEWIARALNAGAGPRAAEAGVAPVTAPPLTAAPVTAADVDFLLWVAGQDPSGLRPYHRTRTPYY